jgi:hypothetical protein
MADLDLQFFIIGAQKCATSWLYYCLSEHPEIALPGKKREEFYLGGAEHHHRGDAWFFARYRSVRGRVRGDVSVEYLEDPESAAYLHRRFPSAKIIVSLRDPIDRAISAYFWSLRHGRIEERDVNTALRALWTSSSASDHAHDFLTRGLYGERLNRYWEHYGEKQLYVLFFEKLTAEPKAVLGDLYRFLGVDPTFVPKALHTKPKKNTYVASVIGIERRLGGAQPLRKLADIFNQSLDRMGFRRALPVLAPELRGALNSYYASDLQALMITLNSLPKSQCPGLERLATIWPTVAALGNSAGKFS